MLVMTQGVLERAIQKTELVQDNIYLGLGLATFNPLCIIAYKWSINFYRQNFFAKILIHTV